MIATKRPHFGFRYSALRDGYEVETETMDVVRRIFRMIGIEGVAIRGVNKIFEWEGLPLPRERASGASSLSEKRLTTTPTGRTPGKR